ncbi:MAG: phosphoenolpyruvate carboxylase, partial [Chitinophagaceae bacterium]|nr:phosphoenolpyruvate carboxylase [Chitinophagaceae bacterium]
MDYQSNKALLQFKNYVGIKFQLYNSLFTSLPFHRIEKTGILLSLLANNCEEGFKKKLSPIQIIEDFFNKHTSYTNEKDQIDVLFRFVQYVERQVVLFDALEDAAFREINDINGIGTLKNLESEVLQTNAQEQLAEKLSDFAVRLVLTAHPTQFYPGSVLGIINDLSKALGDNNAALVNTYLQQLGKTPFFNKQKPTPYDEAISLIWYLENVFYAAAGKISSTLKSQFPDAINPDNPIIRMGFWPGGDRDGNPFVNIDITMQVADALRGAIIKCYYLDVRRLKRRLTFAGVDTLIAGLEIKLYNNVFIPGQKTNLSKNEILETLEEIRNIVIHQHNGLFLHLVNNLINKVEVFGLYFASLDIRQESSVHQKLLHDISQKSDLLPDHYADLADEEKINLLSNFNKTIDPELAADPVHKDTIKTIGAIKTIQLYNGVEGCSRYIISQCTSALNAMEVYGLFLLSGWKKEEM